MPLFSALLIAAMLVAGAGGQAPFAPPRLPPCGACLSIVLTPEQVAALPEDLGGLDVIVSPVTPSAVGAAELLRQIEERRGTPGLSITLGVAPADIASLAGAAVVVIDVGGSTVPGDQLNFALRTLATRLRATGRPILRIGVRASGPQLAWLRPFTGIYWDFVATDAAASVGEASSTWRVGGTLADVPRALDATRDSPASEQWLWQLPADPGAARRLLADTIAARRVLPRGLITTADVQVSCGGRQVDVFLDPVSLVSVALADGCPADAAVATSPALGFERVAVGESTIVRVTDTASGRIAASTEVAARKRLTIEEIVARHQAAAASQVSRLETSISSGTLTLTFEAPSFPAPVTVSSRTTIYRQGSRVDLAQRDVRINGMSFGARGVPRVPLLEPERVSTPPLEITLTDRYRYRLAGEDRADGEACYVVAFEPLGAGPLFRGRAWISQADFGLVRVAAVQTGLRGPIVSSEQVDDFVAVGGVRVLRRSETRQVYQGAAYRTPLVRVLELDEHDVNSESFAARRAATYASTDIIIRDTPRGYRYLGERERSGTQDERPGAEAELPRATRVRTLAFGAILDPNISNPLPFAGLSYIDFDLFGTGLQFNGFFGGTYGQLAFSAPSLAGSRWQLAGRAFAIASTYNDRAFADGREQYDRNIRQRPAHASVWLLRPITPSLAVRAGYELDYTHLTASNLTAPDFVVPADQVGHGLRLAVEAQRGGWDATAWWNPARRSGWHAWGRPGEYDAHERDFQRYGLSVGRTFVLSPAVVARAEGAAMAGSDLDRFSRYTFGTFENRLHGYPSALIRYDRGGVARGTVAWSAASRLRLDGFVDGALVRDHGFADGLTRLAGFGAAVESPAPFGMLLALEWGYGPQGVNADGRRGTHVVRITGYKVF